MTVDCRGENVTCSACGKEYRCTPDADYYNSTTLEDGVCEPCLLNGKKGANPPIPGTIRMTPGLRAAIDSGLVELSPDLVVLSDQ